MAPAVEAKQTELFEQLWKDAEDRFVQLTGKKLDKSEHKGINEVLDQLGRKYDPKDDHGAKTKSRAKANVRLVLRCLQRASEVVKAGLDIAKEVTQVYPPVFICCNVIAMLIDIPAKVDEYYERFADLFQEINFALVQFKVLEQSDRSVPLPSPLVEVIQRLMCSFVVLCALAYGPFKDGKFKRFLKGTRFVLLQDDSPLQSELDNFKALINQQHVLVSTLAFDSSSKTLHTVLRQEAKLDQALDFVERQQEEIVSMSRYLKGKKQEDDTGERQRQLFEHLGVSESTRAAQEEIRRQMALPLQDTGKWLFDESRPFRQWSSPDKDSDSIYFVCGHKGSGKSYLASSIIDRLERAKARERIAVAHYFFPRANSRRDFYNTGTGSDSKQELLIALRHMAYQLAEISEPYSRELKTKPGVKNQSVKELWRSLIIEPAANKNVTFYLVFDGIEQIEGRSSINELFRSMFTSSATTTSSKQSISVPSGVGLGWRALFTCDSSTFTNLQANFPLPPPQTNLELFRQLNRPDIEAFVADRLKKEPALVEFESQEPQIMTEFRETLEEIANGSFTIVQQRIWRVVQMIDRSSDVREIEESMLSRNISDSELVAQTVIQDLQSSLSEPDIQQLNSVLIWLLWIKSGLTPAELNAVSHLSGWRRSLRTFARKFEKQSLYASLFRQLPLPSKPIGIHPELVTALRAMQPVSSSSDTAVDAAEPLISLSVTINQGKAEEVRRFLWKLNETANFDPGFLQLNAPNLRKQAVIEAPIYDSRAIIVSQFLDLLTTGVNPATEPLINHAVDLLPDRVRALLEFEQVNDTAHPLKVKIVEKLLAFFRDVKVPSSHLATRPYVDLWFNKPTCYHAMEDILTESQTAYPVAHKLELKDQYSRHRMMRKTHRPGWLFRRLIKAMARHWLQRPESPADIAFVWVCSYLEKFHFEPDRAPSHRRRAFPFGRAATFARPETFARAETFSPERRAPKDFFQATARPRPRERERERERIENERPITTTHRDIDYSRVTHDLSPDPSVHSRESDSEVYDEGASDDDGEINEQNDSTEDKSDASGRDGHSIDIDIRDRDRDRDSRGSESESGSGARNRASYNAADSETEASDDSHVFVLRKSSRRTTPPSRRGSPRWRPPIPRARVAPEPPELSIERKIELAASWAQKVLKVSELDGLWLEKLADTYLSNDLLNKAIETFQKALERPHDMLRVRLGLAEAYNAKDEWKQALDTLRPLFLKGSTRRSKLEGPDALNAKILRGMCQSRLKLSAEAAVTFEEIIKEKPSQYGTYFKYIMALRDGKEHTKLKKFLTFINRERSETDDGQVQDHSRLVEFCRRMATKPNLIDAYLVVLAARGVGLLSMVENAMRGARENYQLTKSGRLANICYLISAESAAIAYGASSANELDRAYRLWREVERVSNAAELSRSVHRSYALGDIMTYHYRKATREPDMASENVAAMEKIFEENSSTLDSDGYASSLVHYYATHGKLEQAREMLKFRMEDALGYLSDDDPGNDWEGFNLMSALFEKVNDVENALAAYIIVRVLITRVVFIVGGHSPEQFAEIPAPTGLELVKWQDYNPAKGVHIEKTLRALNEVQLGQCHICSTEWTPESLYWRCKVCPNTELCADCLEEVKQNEFTYCECMACHDWIPVPPPTEELRRMVKWGDMVIPHATENGEWSFEGGKTMRISDWLAEVRKVWGIKALGTGDLDDDASNKQLVLYRPPLVPSSTPRPDARRARAVKIRRPIFLKGEERINRREIWDIRRRRN